MRIYLFILVFLAGLKFSYATHIVGGELYYRYLGNNKYRVTLKLYRDCFNSQVPFSGGSEGGAYFDVLDKNYEKLASYPLGEPVVSNVPPSTNNPCIKSPYGICVEEGVYTTTITLAPKTGGYYLEYKTCCRNASILNLKTPTSQGATYRSYIPGPDIAWPNSSPRFKEYPTIFICLGNEISYDHSAIDFDGDYLEYSLCPALNGFNDSLVQYQNPYSGNYPLASNPGMTIHPTTGIISGVPTMQGQWVVCVQVKEYRNGKLLSTHYRDFQFNVISCVVFIEPGISAQQKKCNGSTLTFTNQTLSNFGVTYLWDFGDPNTLSDTSSLTHPSYTFPDTGSYLVTLIVNPGLPCSKSIQRTFYVYPKFDVQYIRPTSPQCIKNNLLTYSVTGTYMPYAQFKFDFGSGANPAVSTQTVTQVVFEESGWHTIHITGKQHICTDTIIDSLQIIARPNAFIGYMPNHMCAPYFVDFNNQSTSEYPASYFWQLSNGLDFFGSQPSYIFEEPGTYSLSLQLIRGGVCPDSSSFQVHSLHVFPKPKASFSYSPEITTILDPEVYVENTSPSSFTQIKYFFGDGSTSSYMNEKYSYQSPGNYVITQWLMNEHGCEDAISSVITIQPEFRCWIPNSFTPDGNGLNDLFYPIVVGVKDYDFRVYTLQGEMIFSSNIPGEGWDGYYKGRRCQQSNYVWRLFYLNEITGKTETKTGHVMVLGENN